MQNAEPGDHAPQQPKQSWLRHYWWLPASFVVPFFCVTAFWTIWEWGDLSHGASQSVDSGFAQEVTGEQEWLYLRQSLPIGIEVGLPCGFICFGVAATTLLFYKISRQRES